MRGAAMNIQPQGANYQNLFSGAPDDGGFYGSNLCLAADVAKQ